MEKVRQTVARAVARAVTEAAAIADSEIVAEKWDWPRTTYRQNGDEVYKPRDIVDTGTLRDSQRISFEASKDKVTGEVAWTAYYAAEVHNGSGAGYKPARPFTYAALTPQLVSDFAAYIRQELR